MQHFLAAAGPTLSVPFILSQNFCMDTDTVGLSELIGTIFVVSGIATLLQTTFGVRLEQKNQCLIIILISKQQPNATLTLLKVT